MPGYHFLRQEQRQAPIKPEWVTYDEREALEVIRELSRAMRREGMPSFARNEMVEALRRQRERIHYQIRRRHVLDIPLTRTEVLDDEHDRTRAAAAATSRAA